MRAPRRRFRRRGSLAWPVLVAVAAAACSSGGGGAPSAGSGTSSSPLSSPPATVVRAGSTVAYDARDDGPCFTLARAGVPEFYLYAGPERPGWTRTAPGGCDSLALRGPVPVPVPEPARGAYDLCPDSRPSACVRLDVRGSSAAGPPGAAVPAGP